MPVERNVQAHPLVERFKIILPPFHIELGIMKQFVKALNKDGDCFKYICTKFPGSMTEKLKAGIFDGPRIRTLINDCGFPNSMNEKNPVLGVPLWKLSRIFWEIEKQSTTKGLWPSN